MKRQSATSTLAERRETELKSQFFDLSLDLLCILDKQGQVEFANAAFLKILHGETRQLECVSFADLVNEADRSTVRAILTNLENILSPLSFACRFSCFDETVGWYLWTLYPQMSGAIHAIGKDITPYREMEAKEVERNIFAEALLDTILAINSSLALDQVLERILSNVGKIVAYEYVSILLVDSDKAEVVGVKNGTEHIKNFKELKGNRLSILENAHLRYMFQSHESFIVPRLERPPAWMVTPQVAEPGAFLGSPIIVDDKVIGFLCVFNSKTGFFTLLHAQQLITFANQVGIAINNARLYEQSQSAAVLRERQRMAQELHDAVNQDLFAASTYADLLPKAILQKPHIVGKYAAEISKLIRCAVAQMRMILIELHPDTLTTMGLDALLQQLCDVFSRQMGIPVKFKTNTKKVLEEDVQIAVYRIAQEALHNIHRHANATHVKVSLIYSNKQLTILIEDDGSGFDQDAIMEVQFGVRGMRERARSIDADLIIESPPGSGTKIRLRKNYHDEKEANSPHSGR
jgi:signal transduction histidine kinase